MKRYIVSIAILLGSASAFAQNLNPKVQVVNDYDVSVAEAAKSGVTMSVPDSLMRFDYKFDYNTFDSAYKGAYAVSQYYVKTAPGAVPVKENDFFLNLGAGYNLRPELNFNWQAARKGRYELGIDNNFGGAYGSFTSVSDAGFTGYDLGENLAVSNIWRLDNVLLKANVAYDGIYNSLEFANLSKSTFNSAMVEFKAASPENSMRSFYYDLGAKYRYANDNCGEIGSLTENYFKLDGKLGPTVQNKYKVLVDFDLEYDGNRGVLDNNAVMFWLKPHVGMTFGVFDLDLGFSLAYSAKFSNEASSPKFRAFPNLEANIKLCDGYFNIFAGVDGEEKLLSYSSMKFREHAYTCDFGMLGESYSEWINAFLGFYGYASNAFQYLVKAGYELNEGRPLPAYDLVSNMPKYAAVDYSKVFAMAMLGWNDERIASDLTFVYNKVWFAGSTIWPENTAVFDEPAFELKFNFTYNWAKRVYAGVMCDWRSAAQSVGLCEYRSTPSFVNLGLQVKYMFNDRFGLWLKGANLLNQELWYSDFYARKGVECTLGITLTL